MAITSASAGEGKTLTAVNLAIVLAEAGKNVLLIDGDLRKPSVHERFDIPNTAGLTAAFLTESRDVSSFLTEVSDGPRVLVAGPRPPSPAQIIGSARLTEMIEGLRPTADIILVDTAPLLGLADAALWLSNVDAVLFVARAGKTRLSDLDEAIRIVEESGTPILGVVLNDSTRAHKKTADYYQRGRS